MSTFLNRTNTVEAILRIISNAKQELVLVVPYIKLSEQVFKGLEKANRRQVEIIIIYREDKLKETERTRLCSLECLSLLSHSDLHAKCYFNEEEMVITSMNLYEYSEKYNREMGVLLTNNDLYGNDEFNSALREVREITRTAKLEQKSQRAQTSGFKPMILKTVNEKLENSCKLINKHFDNKRFEAIDNGNRGEIRCRNYYDNIDVLFEPDFGAIINAETGEFVLHRISIEFKWSEKISKIVHQEFYTSKVEFMFPPFKIYWEYYASNLTIYRDKKTEPRWNDLNLDQTIRKFKIGIDSVTDHLRKMELRFRN